MWLLKTHSHTSECPGYEARRPGYEARKNAKKVLQGNADTIRRQTTRQKLPRTTSVAGGARRKSAIENQPPSKPSRISSAWRGGRDEERRIEGEHRREDKGNQNQNPPAGYHRGQGEGARQKAKTNTKWKGGTTHSPTRGGKCIDENA